MQNVKINSRFEFPHDLNMEPFSASGMEFREKKQKIEKMIEELEKGGEGVEVEKKDSDGLDPKEKL